MGRSMLDVRRRHFIATLGGAAAWPLAARAQQADRVRRIGVLMGYSERDPDARAWYAAFREALQRIGWTEGRTAQIDTRWARPDDVESMQSFAKEIVALQPNVILASTTPPRTRCCSKRTPSPSCLRLLPTQSAAASSPISLGLAATSPVSSLRSRRWPANGWSCSRGLRRALLGSRCCSTRYRRHMPN